MRWKPLHILFHLWKWNGEAPSSNTISHRKRLLFTFYTSPCRLIEENPGMWWWSIASARIYYFQDWLSCVVNLENNFQIRGVVEQRRCMDVFVEIDLPSRFESSYFDGRRRFILCSRVRFEIREFHLITPLSCMLWSRFGRRSLDGC